jgi:hypothetical protein
MNHQEPEPRSDDAPDVDLAGLSILIIDRPEAEITLPWDLAWITYKALQAIGVEDSFHFARAMLTVADIVKYGANIPPGFDDELFYEVWQQVADALHATDYVWETEIERVLHFTYVLLHNRHINHINHAQAAAIASQLLGEKHTEDAWRRRLARWVKARGLPELELKRGRPPKKIVHSKASV